MGHIQINEGFLYAKQTRIQILPIFVRIIIFTDAEFIGTRVLCES